MENWLRRPNSIAIGVTTNPGSMECRSAGNPTPRGAGMTRSVDAVTTFPKQTRPRVKKSLAMAFTLLSNSLEDIASGHCLTRSLGITTIAMIVFAECCSK
jgi:hypothetical protein